MLLILQMKSRMGNDIKLANFLVQLCGLVTLWQEKIATKTLKHKGFTKKKRLKTHNVIALLA